MLNRQQPDLTKLDTFLGLLSASSSDYKNNVVKLAAQYAKATERRQLVNSIVSAFDSKGVVSFQIHYETKPGECLAIVGSNSVLGNGELENAYKMTW